MFIMLGPLMQVHWFGSELMSLTMPWMLRQQAIQAPHFAAGVAKHFALSIGLQNNGVCYYKKQSGVRQ